MFAPIILDLWQLHMKIVIKELEIFIHDYMNANWLIVYYKSKKYSFIIIASEETILLSHMGPPKSAIKSLILIVEQFCIKHFIILFQF